MKVEQILHNFSSRSFFQIIRKMSATITAPKVKLNDGNEMPVLGLGTYLAKESEGIQAVKDAIDAGYRHIDTAFFYLNEKQVGEGIRAKIQDGTVQRKDIFVVTKLWNCFHSPEHVETACRKSFDNLGVGKIDLFLMHMPMGYEYRGFEEENMLPKDAEGNFVFSDVDYVDTWKAMEKCVELGLVKSLGVSNFNSEQVTRVLAAAKIKPVTNQVECNPNINQRKLIKFCKDLDIVLTAYSPLGRPHYAADNPTGPQPALHDNRVKIISEKYNKTPAQVILRYLIDIGTVPIPKSSNKSRIQENINLFDFKLNDEEIQVMDSLNTGDRMVPFKLCLKHKYYPFNIEF